MQAKDRQKGFFLVGVFWFVGIFLFGFWFLEGLEVFFLPQDLK